MTALADSARIGAGDKLHLQGVFDTVFAESFPAIHGTMALVVRLQLESGDQSRVRRVRIRLIDARGECVFEQTARVRVGAIPPGESPCTNLIYHLTNTTFRGPGRYRFEIAAGRTRAVVPLRVLARAV